MPLNENEERILREIESQFHAQDPDSARRIGSTSLPRYLARNCKWSALGLVAGLIILLVAFSTSWVVAVFGFLLMVGSAVVLIRNLHRIGRFGWQQISSAAAGHSLSETLGEAAQRFRRRLGRDED